jgi:hypothetical protein
VSPSYGLPFLRKIAEIAEIVRKIAKVDTSAWAHNLPYGWSSFAAVQSKKQQPQIRW